jgi:hypothetical protein
MRDEAPRDVLLALARRLVAGLEGKGPGRPTYTLGPAPAALNRQLTSHHLGRSGYH